MFNIDAADWFERYFGSVVLGFMIALFVAIMLGWIPDGREVRNVDPDVRVSRYELIGACLEDETLVLTNGEWRGYPEGTLLCVVIEGVRRP